MTRVEDTDGPLPAALSGGEAAYARRLEADPDDLEALQGLAVAALNRDDTPRAVELLRRAARAAPQDPSTQHHLGRALDAAGDRAAAVAAHACAVRAAPESYLLRLYLGASLERSGESDAAVLQYARALQDAQAQDQWANAASTPAALRPLVERAVLAVRTGRKAAFARLLAPLYEAHGRRALARVEACVRGYLLEAAVESPDPRQRPTFLYFPGLPTSAYFERSLFPWIESLEERTDAIRGELVRLLPSASGRERVFTSDELARAHLRNAQSAPSWDGYYFYRHGERHADNCAACPVTSGALESLPLSRVREHGPEVLFSLLSAGTHLLPHRGVTNTRLVGHLPLIVPEDCALNVGGEIHPWQEGRVVVFDDTYEHEAWNRSRELRVVLIFDLWNPHLTDVERAAIAELVPAIGDFRQALTAA
jgi:aspartate beta-hydroxylase